ncbi:MAG TPA: hypothetical protein VGQ89_01440 [Candidatus Limnocylindrales bacterium]|nr:hypothetical protein [Candidatus Limnocylindrales bacterium]
MSAAPAGTVGPATYVRPPLSRPEKYERMAFTFCRMGTVGLIAWAVTPPIFVLVVALVAIALYAKSITLGVSWSKCFLRRPTLIIGFWTAVAAVDAYWIIALGQRWPVL